MDLDEATQKAAEQLGRPVLVFDTDLNVIAFSVHEGDVDHARMMIILSRHASPQAVEMITRWKVRNSRNPVVLPPYNDAQSRVLMPLRHKGRLYGYLSFSEEREVDDLVMHEYMEQLTQASSFLGAILALREIQKQNDSRARRQQLTELFDADPEVRHRSATALLASGGISHAAEYTTVLLRERRGHQQDSDSQASPQLGAQNVLRLVIRSNASTAFGALLQDELAVAIIPGPVDVERLEHVVRHESGDGVLVGIGGRRESLADAADSFREAKIACDAVERLGGPSGILADWAALGVDRLLVQLPLDSLRSTDLPDSVRALLGAHSGIDLAHTLDSYLDCGGEAQETAHRLHIHRSTLYYRLDKIREITGEDLSDGRVRRELHAGLRIARLAGFWEG